MEQENQRLPVPDIRTADGFTAAAKQIERLLFAASYSILGNSDACADVVQSALMKAWESRGSLRERAQFKSWMVQIVQNESRNYLRKRPNLPLDENMPGAEEDPARLDVKQAVNALPESARFLVMLYYFERYPVKDICALLNLPEGTVHSRLSRAREQLRKELSDYER
ncbi:MAG: sigma-70 family RNA polymerase sigma factor [Christensenella sp.]|nr:sigma-70 family RNA polymerase sigma factor [Christensenella sp.]